uniref:protein-S-isoprenylcysteine alpha-carbonyl methylesterase n=1 Tax=Rhizophora mucronata TaxID=61149 RepID=A0A2P2MVC0_RHIMU
MGKVSSTSVNHNWLQCPCRNFPRGTISDMVADASRGISSIFNNIAEYGGDPNRIFLMGQSAGAHISSCALLEQAIKEAKKRRKHILECHSDRSLFWSIWRVNF